MYSFSRLGLLITLTYTNSPTAQLTSVVNRGTHTVLSIIPMANLCLLCTKFLLLPGELKFEDFDCALRGVRVEGRL